MIVFKFNDSTQEFFNKYKGFTVAEVLQCLEREKCHEKR